MPLVHERIRKRSRARKFLIAIGLVVAVILIVIFALPSLIDVNRYHDRIQSELESRLGRKVELGPMRLSIVPLAFKVENAIIGEDPGFPTGKPFAKAQELDVSAQLWPLLHGDVQIDALTLKTPVVELVRNSQGVWNFTSLGKPPAQQPAPAAPPPGGPQAAAQPPQPSGQKQFSLADLSISDGQVAITDEQKHQPRVVYDHIDLDAHNFAPDRAFDLDVAAHLPGQGNQLIKLSGTIGPLNMSDMTATPFDGKLTLDEASISSLQKFLNSPVLAGTDARVTGKMDIKNQDANLASSGSVKLDQPKVGNVDIGYPITLDYVIADNLQTDLLNIGKADLKLGGTPVSIAGTVDMHPTPSRLDLSVKAGDISIQEVARLASAFGVAFNPGTQIAGKLNADIKVQGAASNPALTGQLQASNLVITGKELPQAVKVPQIQLALTPDSIQSNEFSATTGGTTVAVKFGLNNYTRPGSTIDATVRTVNGKVNELLAIAKAYGVSAAEGMEGSGEVSLDVHATGPAKNMNAMSFSGTGVLQSAMLKVPSIGKPLLIKNANLQFTKNSAVLNNFSGSLGSTSANGQMTIGNFDDPVVKFTLSADKMIVDEWQQMFNAQPAPAQAGSFWQIVPQAYAAAAQPSMFSKMTGGGTINVGSILYDQLTMTDAKANVTLDHGIIRMSPVTAQLFGGQEVGTITVDMRGSTATYAVNSKLQNVDANKLLSSTTSLKETLFGLLAANANTSFTGGSAPSDSIARTLNGTLDLNLVNGRLAGMDILNALASIGKFLNYNTPAQPFTNIVKLTGNFDIRNGVATTNNLQANLGQGTMGATGTINLADQTLDLRATAVLSKSFSQMVGGNQIGGFMNTALANANGELVIPVIVSGSFQHPKFAPDLQALAEMKLKNMVPTAGNLGNILGTILGKPAQGQQGQPQQQPGIGGIIGAITGQQQQPQQQQPGAAGTQQGQQPPQQQQPQQQPQQQQQQPANPIGNILQQIFGGKQQQQQPASQQQTPAQQPQQQPNQQQSPPEQPR